MRASLIAAALLTAGLAGSAYAAPWVVGGTVTLRSGVESNPYLRQGESGAAGLFNLSGNIQASQEGARSKTSLLGSAEVGQYVSKYGRNTNFLVGASRDQSLTEQLKLSGGVTYTNTLNPQSNFGFDPTLDTATIDYLTIGTRSERIDGYLSGDWRPSDRDVFRFGGTATHWTYSSAIASRNDQYGGNFSYLRTIDARTSLGVSLGATTIRSSGFPSSQSYTANLLVVRQISAVWSFDGGIGLVRQHTNGFGAADRTTIGFNGSLCGTYPRSNICFTASRQSAPSGLGGLRTDTRFAVNGSHSLTERSRMTVSAGFNNSTSNDRLTIPRQRYYDATLGFDHDLTSRIIVGALARYQRRETTGSSPLLFAGSSSSYSLGATVSYAFGHRGS